MSPPTIVLYCGLLLSVTAFSVDITLPAFGIIADDLNADYGRVQLIIPIFLMFTGVGQITMGPLSDRFGRKPIVLAGLLIYALGATICQFAPTIDVLLGGRALQGMGAAVGPVVGRAIIRDLFNGTELARNLALATMIFAFGPIIAPLLGISILTLGSWRLIFSAITVFGLVLLTIGWLALPETTRNKNRDATRIGSMYQNSLVMIKHAQSRFFLLLSGPIMAMMMIILVSIPRVFFESFGVEGVEFAILFALHGLGIIIGQTVNRRIIPRVGTATAMKTGSGVLLACTATMAVLNWLDLMSAYVLTVTMIAYATGYLVVFSNATALTLEPHGDIAGFVSSAFGFTSQLIAAILAIVFAIVIRGDLSTFIWVLLVVSGSVFTTLLVGDPTRNNPEMD